MSILKIILNKKSSKTINKIKKNSNKNNNIKKKNTSPILPNSISNSIT